MMIGVFDSGVGGRFALAELRRLMNKIDTVFYADEKNAPYGSKTAAELEVLVGSGIERLLSSGAQRVLLACCTAATVYDRLPSEYRKMSVPIIEPTALRAAGLTRGGRIGVLSTEATRRSGVFRNAIMRQGLPEPVCIAAPELVTLAESGAADGHLTDKQREIIYRAVAPLKEKRVDTVVLGCTHFAYFEQEITDMLGVAAVNSARVGAEHIAADIKNEGRGAELYLR